MSEIAVARRPERLPVVVMAFATTVAMWIIGFIGRLPAIQLHGAILSVFMFACLIGGGWLFGNRTRQGFVAGAVVGLLTAVINLLVLGSLLGGDEVNEVRPSAALWGPGFLVSVAAVMGGAAWIGAKSAVREANSTLWIAWMTSTAAVLTFFLLLVGGLVTSFEAGLAVPDWPNSYGYNMFLFPLSRMVGGIYFEHTHRLFGSLVGLLTLVMTVCLWRLPVGRGVRWTSFGVLLLVIVQGIIGGFRVTGRLTTETSFEAMNPKLELAVVHGVLGQIVFALMVAMAVATTAAWKDWRLQREVEVASTDRSMSVMLIVVLVLQLIAGAVVRHYGQGEMIHITGAVFVLLLALTCGVRAWAMHQDMPVLNRCGKYLVILTSVQLVLGIVALVVSRISEGQDPRPMSDIIFTTAHQITGAMVLAVATMVMLWNYRLLREKKAA